MKILLELNIDQAVMVRDGLDILQPDTDEAADMQEELLQWLNQAIEGKTT